MSSASSELLIWLETQMVQPEELFQIWRSSVCFRSWRCASLNLVDRLKCSALDGVEED